MILVLLGTQNNSFHRLLEEVEKKYSEREKELIDFLVKHYEEMSDDNIRATINLIDTGRMVVDTRRMYERIIKRGF